MTNEHLSEEELQQYAMGVLQPQHLHEHLKHCPVCSSELKLYKELFTVIKQADTPQFDFDLAESVVAQLPTASGASFEKFPVLLAIITSSLFVAALCWMFSDFLVNLFSGSRIIIQMAIVAVVVTILILQTIDVIKRYQKKMQALDFI